jgi:hypothetical protein
MRHQRDPREAPQAGLASCAPWPALTRGVAWRGVAWRGVAWRGDAQLRPAARGLQGK